MNEKYQNPRLDHSLNEGKSVSGEVYLDNGKVLWLSLVTISGTLGSALTFSWPALFLFVFFTAFVLLFGHSLGMHRLFIHNSYATPYWLKIFLVHIGTIVGIAGPLGMLKTHDTRDWAQRQKTCHPFFAHGKPWWHDFYWQLLCSFKLNQPLHFALEPDIKHDEVILWMEKTWVLQQLPWAVLFYYLGGWGFVFWGISTRILVSNLGHWLIGYFAHNEGGRTWHVQGAAVQGHDVKWTSLLTMGECWHNNHHAFPFSANFGLNKGQWDPGWWTLLILKHMGLAWNFVKPDLGNVRDEVVKL